MPTSERSFRAMGSDCHVVVAATDHVVGAELVRLAVERVELLEQSWSRFRQSSELSRLNAAAGSGPVQVSSDMYALAAHMALAWQETEGLFDPTVLRSLQAHGYDSDFAIVAGRPGAASIADVGAAPGMSGVRLDQAALTVELPAGVSIDPGAIGKGLGADLVVAELMSTGASGVLVNLGGDLAFAGSPDGGAPWAIGVEDERLPVGDRRRTLRVIEFPADSPDAGVATSTTLKRRWAQGRRHHVIDPRTGAMSSGDLVQVTIVANQAWRAEVLATTALLLDASGAERWLRELDVPAVLLTTDREIFTMDQAA